MDEKIMTFTAWKQLMQSEDGEFYRLSDDEKMFQYNNYLWRVLERHQIIMDEQRKDKELLKELAFDIGDENKQLRERNEELLKIVNGEGKLMSMDIEKALERLNYLHTSVKLAEEYGTNISLTVLRLEIEIIQNCLQGGSEK